MAALTLAAKLRQRASLGWARTVERPLSVTGQVRERSVRLLSEPQLVGWPSYESFRAPARGPWGRCKGAREGRSLNGSREDCRLGRGQSLEVPGGRLWRRPMKELVDLMKLPSYRTRSRCWVWSCLMRESIQLGFGRPERSTRSSHVRQRVEDQGVLGGRCLRRWSQMGGRGSMKRAQVRRCCQRVCLPCVRAPLAQKAWSLSREGPQSYHVMSTRRCRLPKVPGG